MAGEEEHVCGAPPPARLLQDHQPAPELEEAGPVLLDPPCGAFKDLHT